jgi:hypothetical protein
MLPRLPASIIAAYPSANSFYITIKCCVIQANYPICSCNILVFSIKKTIIEKLMRSLAFIFSNCYTQADFEDLYDISGEF